MKVIPNLLFALLLGAIIFTGSVAHLAVGKKKAKDKQAEEAKPDFQEVFKKLDAGARAAMKKDPKEGLKEVERVGRLLIKDYPEEPIPYSMLAFVAGRVSDKEKKVSIFKELAAIKSPNPKVAQVVGRAKGELKKMEALGKPLEMKFTAVDGREVDLSKMKGKVVLIDFWATWCGPCIQELPNVKKAYGELHEKGFEIIGISLDKDEKKLSDFVAKNEMPWAQFCDGKGWANTLAKEHGIRSIPAMWLVDKKGNLVDQSARSGLEAKVKKYLAATKSSNPKVAQDVGRVLASRIINEEGTAQEIFTLLKEKTLEEIKELLGKPHAIFIGEDGKCRNVGFSLHTRWGYNISHKNSVSGEGFPSFVLTTDNLSGKITNVESTRNVHLTMHDLMGIWIPKISKLRPFTQEQLEYQNFLKGYDRDLASKESELTSSNDPAQNIKEKLKKKRLPEEHQGLRPR